MKLLLTAGLLVFVPPLLADDAPKAAPTTNAPVAIAVQATLPPPTMTLSPANQTAVQRRLQPPTEAQLIERYGTGGFMLKRRSAGSALQLLNPFADRSYGNTGPVPATWSWNPNYAPGTPPPPRAFRDEKALEPSGVIFGGRF